VDEEDSFFTKLSRGFHSQLVTWLEGENQPVEATNTRYVPMCQSDNNMATVATQKCKSQYLFAYFNLHTTMRDTSLSLLLLTSYRLLATDVRPQSPSSSAESYLVQRRRSFY
jgi:hypothetical protein